MRRTLELVRNFVTKDLHPFSAMLVKDGQGIDPLMEATGLKLHAEYTAKYGADRHQSINRAVHSDRGNGHVRHGPKTADRTRATNL